MLPTKFRVNWSLGSGEKAKNRFSRLPPWPTSWISNRNNSSFFFLSTHHPDASYQVSSLSVQEKKWKTDFQNGHHGSHFGFPIRTILAIFDLQVPPPPMLPTKFQANWPYSSGEEANNRFSSLPPWQPSSNSNRTDFSYFWSKGHPNASYRVQDGCHSGHLGFPIRLIVSIFDLQFTLMLPTKLWIYWTLGSGEEGKNRFLAILDFWSEWFCYLWCTSHPRCLVHWPRGLKE